ncbi:MAG: alcohol dehydrogenase catalytic domain-containing protein [Streptomyces sp.]|nr:alcohol dehydrogenase catalytic domain-containing protein [Streptomyces sp.]
MRSDVAKLNHPWQGRLPEPWYPGHEIVGVDTETGDWVAIDPLVSCRSCHYCDRGHVHLCPRLQRIGWDLPGGLAGCVRAPRESIVPLRHLHDLARSPRRSDGGGPARSPLRATYAYGAARHHRGRRPCGVHGHLRVRGGVGRAHAGQGTLTVASTALRPRPAHHSPLR